MLFYVNFLLKHCVKQNFIKVYKSNVTYFNLVSFSCKETYFKTNFELKLICFQIRERERERRQLKLTKTSLLKVGFLEVVPKAQEIELKSCLRQRENVRTQLMN